MTLDPYRPLSAEQRQSIRDHTDEQIRDAILERVIEHFLTAGLCTHAQLAELLRLEADILDQAHDHATRFADDPITTQEVANEPVD